MRLLRNEQATSRQIACAVEVAVTWGLATVFVVSSIPHLGNPYYFLGSINSYGLFDPRIGEASAMVLPVLQLVVAVCLLAGICRDAAHSVAFVLLGAFAFIQSMAWARGMEIPCGCFGPRHETNIGLLSLLRVYGLLAASAIRNGFRLYSCQSVSPADFRDSDGPGRGAQSGGRPFVQSIESVP